MRPFTLAEATEIAEDFEDLVDTEFITAGVFYLVLDVLVVPFTTLSKDVYAANYDPALGVGQFLASPDGDDYDVIILVQDVEQKRPRLCIDIRSYTGERGIKYHYP
jgi:hypothetical protein